MLQGGLTVTEATLTIADDDTRGVGVSENSLTVPEGASRTYTVVLESQPSGPVTVATAIASGAQFTVDRTALTFTAESWHQAQTVTVTADTDEDAAAPPPAPVSHTVSGADYAGQAAASVTVQVQDDSPIASGELTLAVAPGLRAGGRR